METVNIHEAKTHLSRLIERAVAGEPFIIAKAGKPMVKVTAIAEPSESPRRRLGFLKGQPTPRSPAAARRSWPPISARWP